MYNKYANNTKDKDQLFSVSKTFTKPDTTTLTASTRYVYNSDGSLATISPHTDLGLYYYRLTYDAYGNMSNTKVVNQDLMTNTYNANNGKLQLSTYGNGNTIGYTYGDYSRVIEKKYNGVARFKYAYDKEGNLYSYQDLNNVSSPLTYNYSYDVTKRLSSVVGSNGHKMNFKYDAYNRLADFFNIFGETSYKTSYVYGTGASTASQAGLLYGIKLNGSQKLTYTYDALSRLSTKTLNGAGNYAVNYSFLDGTGTNTTTLLSSMQNGSNGVLSYTYDMKGNILTITEGTTLKATYTYWTASQKVDLKNLISYAYNLKIKETVISV